MPEEWEVAGSVWDQKDTPGWRSEAAACPSFTTHLWGATEHWGFLISTCDDSLEKAWNYPLQQEESLNFTTRTKTNKQKNPKGCFSAIFYNLHKVSLIFEHGRAHNVICWRHMVTAHAALTLIYQPCEHMFPWSSKSSGCVAAYAYYWIWPTCDLSSMSCFLCEINSLYGICLEKYMCQQVLSKHENDICLCFAEFVYM